MRHVRSIGYAVVLAAAVWVLCGAGLGHGGTGTGVRNYPALLLAGAAYAILILAPISPAGPLVTGMAFFGASVWALASPSSYADLWPTGVTWADLSLPGRGIAAILAVPMVATALSARRWETYEPPELPVFGRLGRIPGAARPAGTPAAGMATAVPRLSDPDSTVMVIDMDQTQVVRAPQPPAPEPAALVPDLVPERVPSADPTVVVPERPADETMAIPPQAASPRSAVTPSADATIVIPNPEAVAAADATQVIPRDLGGGRQVIRPPVRPAEPDDADRTQVVSLPKEPTEPAESADDTRVLEIPQIPGPRRRRDDEAG